MKKGNVILLNGTSSSGKSTIAEALQAVMDEPYLHTGIDHYLARLPKNLIVYSDGQTPSSAEGWLTVFKDRHLVDVILGPLGLRLIKGMYQAIAAFASAGNAVIVDDVIYDPRILSAAVNALRTIPVFFVGVQCPLDVAESRERARGDRAPGGGAPSTTRCTLIRSTTLRSIRRSLRPWNVRCRSRKRCEKLYPGRPLIN